MSFSIEYVYKLLDRFTGPSKSISKAAEDIDKTVTKTTKGFGGLSDTITTSSNSALAALKGLAIGAAAYLSIGALVNDAQAFENAMVDLSAITGAVGDDLKYLEARSIALGAASNTMHSEVANAIKMVASAKSELLEDPKALSSITEQILLLKNATGVELPQATQVVVDSLNQFGAGAEQAARFVNVLAASGQVGAAELGESGVAIVKSGVAAKMAKVGFEELNAMIQVLAKNGVKAEVAGTGLKTALLRLETSGVKKLTPSIVGINTALENLAASNLSAEEMQKMFGLEAIAVGAILKDNVQLIKQWTKEITGTDIASEQAKIRLNTLSVKFNQFFLLVKGWFIKLYVSVAPALIGVLDGLMNIKEFIKDFANEYPNLSKFAAIVVGVSVAIGAAVLVMKGLAIAIGLVKIAMIAITGPIGLVVAAISGAIYLFSEFSGRWSELPAAAMDALNEMLNFIIANNPIDLLINSFKKLIDMVSNFSALDTLKSVTASVKGFFGIETPTTALAPSGGNVIGIETPTTALTQPGGGAVGAGLAGVASGAGLVEYKSRSSVDVNVNVNDRGGNVSSVQSKTKSDGAKLNTGVNLR